MTLAQSVAERLAAQLGAPTGDRDGTKLVPMLCDRDESGERVLAQGGYIFELKLDGVRILADKRGDRVALGYRTVRSATESYPEIAEAIAKLAEHRVVLDGEVVAFDDEGRPDFQRLGTRIQSRGRSARRAAATVPVAYVVFDVLVVGDRDVTSLPIEARKAILEQIVGEASKAGGHLRLHPTFAEGTDLFRLCRAHQLEGVVAKRAGSIYRPDDRSSDWIKIKCEQDADLVVVGWAEGEGKRSRLGALDLGVYEGDALVFRGSVGSGLDEDAIDVLLGRLAPLEVKESAASGKMPPKRGRHFVRPEVVVSVRYMGMSGEGMLRHPVYRGMRDDLDPRECTADGLGRGRKADTDLITLRISSKDGDADAVARAAQRTKALIEATGLVPVPKKRGASIDVQIPIGAGAPADASLLLATLLERLLGPVAATEGATIARVAAPTAPLERAAKHRVDAVDAMAAEAPSFARVVATIEQMVASGAFEKR